MARPAPYLNARGEKVPGTTTVCGRFKDSGALLWWANQVGLGERDCDEQEPCRHCGRRKGKTHREAMNKAADVGTYAHALIDERVKGTPVDPDLYAHLTSEQLDQAGDCLEAFDRWFASYDVEIIETEFRIVSEQYQFGGMFDALWRVGGKLALGDWKTSKGLYADYLAQVAGGYLLCVEELDLWGPVDEVHLIRISKDIASFHHHSWPRKSLQPAIDYFVTIRKAFDQAKALESLLK